MLMHSSEVESHLHNLVEQTLKSGKADYILSNINSVTSYSDVVCYKSIKELAR